MTTHLVTFATDDMSKSAALCRSSAKVHGVDSVWLCSPADRERTNERGFGFWKWKPAIIHALLQGHDAFAQLNDSDILIYSDAGIEFIDSVTHIVARMDQDIFLFGNQWEHAHWCKRDIVEAIMPGVPWEAFGKQAQASVIFFRVNDASREFVKDWLALCVGEFRVNGREGLRLIDDSPSVFPNHPEFRENRHDQAILTTMAYRDGIKLHWWPAQYNDGAFVYERGDYPDEGYPVLFHHHRRRNHEWSVAA